MKKFLSKVKAEISLIIRGYRTLFAAGHRGTLLYRAGEAAVRAAAPLITLYFSGQIIDELTGAGDGQRLLLLAALTVGCNLLLLLLRNFLKRKWEALEKTLWCDGYMVLSRKMLTMDYEHVEDVKVHERLEKIKQLQNWNGHGLLQLVYVVDEFAEGLVGTVSSLILGAGLFAAVSHGVSGPAELLASHWGTAIFAALLLLSLVVFQICTRLEAKASENMDETMTLVNRLFTYYFWTIPNDHKLGKDVRLYNEAGLLEQEMDENLAEDRNFFSKVVRDCALPIGISAAMPYLAGLLVYLMVAAKASLGLIGIGGVVAYVGAMNRLASGIQKLFHSVSELTANSIHLREVFAFLDIGSEKYNGTLPTEKRDDGEYLIEFHDVSFKYPGTEVWALRHLNLKLKIGERLAVVGRNGSGKTTMIKLLCRLYDPTEGVITLNGIDIQKYNYQEYLDLFSVVFQDFHLFSFELGQSVAASMEYDEKRVRGSLKEAGLEERLSKMPHGLDTYLNKDFEEEGVEVSGGEAQKIAIARALYKDAPFLVLDEPTAALDPVSEFEVYRKFSQIAENKTSVCISHRLSSCRFCDRIAVFQKGELVQIGAHDRLLEDTEDAYCKLWNAQAQYYNEEESTLLLQ